MESLALVCVSVVCNVNVPIGFRSECEQASNQLTTARFIAASGPMRGRERGRERRVKRAPERERVDSSCPPFIVADGDVLVYVRLLFDECS